MKYPKISIIFPTYNGLIDTKACLNSIAKLNYPPNKLEIIIVDNGSIDGTPEWVKKHYPQVKIIKFKKNLGFAKAVNVGLKKASGGYLFITNNDTVLTKNYFWPLLKLFSSQNKIGIAGGQILYKKPKGKNTMPGYRLNLYFGWHAYDLNNLDKIREVEWFPGSAMLVKKEVFEKVGFFDEGYFFGSEDYDFCLLARKAGYRIYYAPKAILYHGMATAAKKLGENQRFYFNYQSKFRLVIKNATILQMLTFFPTQLILGPVISYIRFGHKTFSPMILALKWNLNHLKETLKARKAVKKLSL